MSLLLYINGQLVDLDPKQNIAQTKQVNDLNSLQDRQASYTNKFKLPKTATNLKIMDFLTLTGNNSNAPYKKNECSLYSAETGECFVYKGRAVVTDNGGSYNVVIYDGIIDLYKKIENKKLSDLDLSGLVHDKNVASVIASWGYGDKNYRYIVADYNGNTGDTANGEINIDYLVPSAWVPYLWEQIEAFTSSVFNGAVFETEKFRNLYMTYPKGISIIDEESLVYECEYNFLKVYQGYFNQSTGRYITIQANHYPLEVNEFSPTSADNQRVHFIVNESGNYKISAEGRLGNVFIVDGEKFFIKLGLNAMEFDAHEIPSNITIAGNIIPNEDFSASITYQLQEGDTISFYVTKNHNGYQDDMYIDTLKIKVEKLNNTIQFGEALTDFSIKDFMTEIIQRFGLTIYKKKYSNEYDFLTLAETLQTAALVDWSDKFISKEKESYIYGSYAQKNNFKYNYNDKENDYHDSYITIDNVNLKDAKDILKSKIYSPERTTVDYLNRETNVYKLWNKEIKEGETDEETGETSPPTTEYKNLDKRYYFLRDDIKYSNDLGFSNFHVTSTELSENQNAYVARVERFWKLRFSDIKTDYYTEIAKILDKSIIVTAKMWLNEVDIANFDFKKLYYIEQLSNYFIVNKINNYIPGKATTVELVRVIYGEASDTVLQNGEITILDAVQTGNDYEISYTIGYDIDDFDVFVFQISIDGIQWDNMDGEYGIIGSNVSTDPIVLENLNHQDHKGGFIRILDFNSGLSSNVYEFRKITITNLESLGNNIYKITYNSNYTPPSTSIVHRIEVLINGIWVDADDYTGTYSGIKQVDLSDYPTATQVRIKNNISEITSNAYLL